MGTGTVSGFACGYAGIVFPRPGAEKQKAPRHQAGLKCNKTVLR
jgi:hypothetical protein